MPLDEYTDRQLLEELVRRNPPKRSPVRTILNYPYDESLVAVGKDHTARITFPRDAPLHDGGLE